MKRFMQTHSDQSTSISKQHLDQRMILRMDQVGDPDL